MKCGNLFLNLKITHSNIRVYQPPRIINKKVYVKQPSRFISDSFQTILSGLKQAPCAWYEKLSSFLMNNGFCRGKEFSKLMQDEFEISMMGELKFFMGLQIEQIDEDIFIHQSNYANELLKKFKLEDCKSMCTPMHPMFVMTLDDSDKKVDQTTYHGMINFLLYLTASRPDLMFSFQSDIGEFHLTVVKRIFRYIKDTTNLGLLFKKSN
ncbi:Copia protein, partial [Mucuna pruriens]